MSATSEATRPQTATAREATMKAIVQDTYGTEDVLEYRDIDKPAPGTARCWCGCARPAWTGASGTS
jgi:hypothetical protein